MLKQMESITDPDRNEDKTEEPTNDKLRGSKISIKASALTGIL